MNDSYPLNIYIDQESDGMWFIGDFDEDATKLSHAEFIQGDWLFQLSLKGKAWVRLIIERAHGVDAQRSPAQRFSTEQWAFFKQQCRQASAHNGFRIELHAWPERTTPLHERFFTAMQKRL